MTSYFIRLFLLIIPTFLGITILIFFVMQMVPGGPLEQELLRIQMGMMSQGETAGGSTDLVGSQVPADLVRPGLNDVPLAHAIVSPARRTVR